MSSFLPGGAAPGVALKEALRAIRKHRGLRPADIAARMGLPLRSYEHFEAGGGQLNVERVFQFAEATDSDPYAILFGAIVGAPDFALRCADNKLALILALAVQDFNEDLGDDIAALEAGVLIGRFTKIFAELAEQARQTEASTAAWLARRRPPGTP